MLAPRKALPAAALVNGKHALPGDFEDILLPADAEMKSYFTVQPTASLS
jgi:hypothetical protein